MKQNTDIVVSIACTAYNHENYISKTIDSFLMQKISFPFEIIIGEDCSADKTREIVIQYKKKYPELITVITSEKNIGAKKNGLRTRAACKGKYTVLCEGDDYWTDPDKLQKQVDFLEANPDFAICFHNMQIIYEGKPEKNKLSNINQKEITTIHDLAKSNYIYTASSMFRKQNFELPEWFYKSPVGDYPLYLLSARYGKIKFINEVMGVYRIHDKGMWGSRTHEHVSTNFLKTRELSIGYFDKKTDKILKNQYRKNAMHLAITYLNINNTEDAHKYFIKAKQYTSKIKILSASFYYLIKLFFKILKII